MLQIVVDMLTLAAWFVVETVSAGCVAVAVLLVLLVGVVSGFWNTTSKTWATAGCVSEGITEDKKSLKCKCGHTTGQSQHQQHQQHQQ